ncbi:uncharacterized protein LOC111296983 isoform X1 [Durio zibethinus]|uniref:Uncharacterized protein LOC111296983 isoform X1 n=1 Tax=Durio zibethinus TaxID=66656 RepID=A0A6P5Z3A1_DURZI|nr:uncharacterized protein LOC111296983 isoform X1 [Durio zibethinus]
MQSLESITDSQFPQNPNNFSSSSSSSVNGLHGWLFECHGLWHNLALIISSLIFVLFLGFQAKKSFQKLSHGRSYIMISYYGCVWLVSLLNLAWCFLQAWECTPGKEMAWNILSLFTTSGMLFLEVSLVAFLLQGNYASGLEALTRTFVVSGLIAGLDLLLKVFLLFLNVAPFLEVALSVADFVKTCIRWWWKNMTVSSLLHFNINSRVCIPRGLLLVVTYFNFFSNLDVKYDCIYMFSFFLFSNI